MKKKKQNSFVQVIRPRSIFNKLKLFHLTRERSLVVVIVLVEISQIVSMKSTVDSVIYGHSQTVNDSITLTSTPYVFNLFGQTVKILRK